MVDHRWGHRGSPDDDDSQAVEQYEHEESRLAAEAERSGFRLAALEGAVRLAEARSGSDSFATVPVNVCASADALYAWLTGLRLVLDIESVTEQGSGTEVQIEFTPGGALQLTDTQEFTASVEAKDAKGNAVPATLTWSADDNGAVVTLTPSADTLSCLFTAVAPGTANYTVSDGALSATGQAVVTAGAAADLVLTEAAPVDQAPPAPPAVPPAS